MAVLDMPRGSGMASHPTVLAITKQVYISGKNMTSGLEHPR